jgi:hypothetical protein
MEKKQITEGMKQALGRPLPATALKPHPKLAGKSAINAIYVSERLNEVFGIGEWTTAVEFTAKNTYIQHTKNGDKEKNMVVVKLTLEVPAYGIHYECYGGNDNDDYGDAYKGATTDALTKIGSWMGIGAHVWKDDPTGAKTATPQPAPAPQPTLTKEQMEKIVIDYLYSNEKAENHYLNKYQVKDMLELNLIEIYHELKSYKKI